MSAPTFNTITGADWAFALRRAHAEPNRVALLIREKISSCAPQNANTTEARRAGEIPAAREGDDRGARRPPGHYPPMNNPADTIPASKK
jgi:hypothetical protein